MSNETVPAPDAPVLSRRFVPSKKTLLIGVAAVVAAAYLVITKLDTTAEQIEEVNPTDLPG